MIPYSMQYAQQLNRDIRAKILAYPTYTDRRKRRSAWGHDRRGWFPMDRVRAHRGQLQGRDSSTGTWRPLSHNRAWTVTTEQFPPFAPWFKSRDVYDRHRLTRVYVSVYFVTRHFGGPEEGGWWYNWHERIVTVATTLAGSEAVRSRLIRRYKNRQWGNISSVHGGQEVHVMVEETAGEYETTEAPHYE